MRAAESVRVELRPFNDRQLNRDLVVVCERVNKASLQFPDGRHLVLSVGGMTPLAPDTLSGTGTIKKHDQGPPVLEPFLFPSPRLL